MNDYYMSKKGSTTKSSASSHINSSQNNDFLFKNLEVKEWIHKLDGFIDFRITIIDLMDNVIYTSANSEKVIGYNFEHFKLLASFGYIHPDDRHKVVETFRTLNSQGFSKSILYRTFTPIGELRWIRGMAQEFINDDRRMGTIILEFDISAEIKAILPIKHSEESFYKSLLDLIQVPIIYIRNNLIMYANRFWEEKFGYAFDAVSNNSLEMIFANQDEFAKFLYELNQNLQKNSLENQCYNLVTKDKEILNLEIHAYPVDTSNLSKGILLFLVDVFTLKQKLKINDDELFFYNSAVENYDGIFLRIKNNIILNTNKSIDILQYNKEEVIGQNISMFFQTKDSHKEFRSGISNSFIRGVNFTKELNLIRKDRMPVPFNVRAFQSSLIEPHDYIITLEPMNELRQIINSLREEKSELDFYSDNMFHDVKNICQNIHSNLEISLLQMTNSPEEAKERQEISKMGVLKIAEMIANLDKFFKIKRKEYEIVPYDIYLSIEKTIRVLKEQHEYRAIKITHNLESEKYFTYGNELIDDIFYNLIDIALMHDRRPEIDIAVKISNSSSYDDYWVLELLFESPLINKEMNRFLSTKYVKQHDSNIGSGFGLALVIAIIESINSHIVIKENEPTKGTLIELHIPKVIE